MGATKESTITFSTHIYIVDDNQSFGRSLKRFLNVQGIAADYFESAQSFLDCIAPDQKGCAIVDIHMPGCDGFTLIARMRYLNYAMPVIMITGHVDQENRELAMKMGIVGFLQKPFNEKSLLELIKKINESAVDA